MEPGFAGIFKHWEAVALPLSIRFPPAARGKGASALAQGGNGLATFGGRGRALSRGRFPQGKLPLPVDDFG